MPDGHSEVSRSEMRHFVQDQETGDPKRSDWGLSTRSGAKKIKGLCGDVLEYVAQENPQFDVEIGQKNHFRMETNYKLRLRAPLATGHWMYLT